MMRTKLAAGAVVALGAVSAAPASAVTNFTSNFDDVTFADGMHIVSSIDGWTASSPLNIGVLTGSALGAPKSGANYVTLDTTGNSSMSRLIDAGNYTISFAYSPRPGAASTTDGIALFLDSTQLRSIAASGVNRTNTAWATISYSFTAAQASTLKFAATGASDGVGGYLDNIALVGSALPVPEPGEWAMIAAGLGAVGLTARRRRKL